MASSGPLGEKMCYVWILGLKLKKVSNIIIWTHGAESTGQFRDSQGECCDFNFINIHPNTEYLNLISLPLFPYHHNKPIDNSVNG